MGHYVTCLVCGTRFDRDKVPAKEVKARRYVHVECFSEYESKIQNAAENDYQELTAYIDKLFGKGRTNWPLVGKQLKTYKEENGYSYSGMLKCLKYAYEIKNEDISKAKGVGVIPIYWQEAYYYYYSIWEAQQHIKNINLKEYIPKEEKIIIPRPMIKIKKKKNLFKFLDEEENGE